MTDHAITWLLTWTTYGTWLPGDARGFVGRVRERRPEDQSSYLQRTKHHDVGTEYDREMPGLKQASRALMKGDPVWLNRNQADSVLKQFRTTADHRNWHWHAGSVMANHVHLVITASETIPSDHLLRDFKSYGSRALTAKWGKPAGGTWWTASGSRRMLPDERAVEAAIRYVLKQHCMLACWPNPDQS